MPPYARAAVFVAPKTPLSIQSFHVPELGPGEVTVRIRCATVCASDLHTCLGRRSNPAPSILGHEIAGEIAALHTTGALDFRGRPLAPGDRITWSMLRNCGECFYCRLELVSKCEKLRKFGHEKLDQAGGLFGGYAEYCHLPAGMAIFKIPDHVPDSVAAPASCAAATAAAAIREAGNLDGSTIIVCGAGMLGLTACAMASASKARCVIAVEPDPGRRAVARSFGADLTIDPFAPGADVPASIAGATAGRGADLALEFAGTPQACESMLPLLRLGGHLVMAGSVFPSTPMRIRSQDVVTRMLRISGVHNYRPPDLERGLQFLAGEGRGFPFPDLIGGTFPLDRINEAIEFAEINKPPRVAVVPE